MGDAATEAKAKLDLDEASARIEKLRAETRLLDIQLAPATQRREVIKAYATAAGVLTTLVAIVALFVSVWQGINQLSEARAAKAQERLDKAIADVGSGSPGQRLSGVANLRSFLGTSVGSGQHDRQILLALVHSLAIEESSTVRSALQEVLTNVDPAFVELAAREAALQGLIGLSRGLVYEGELNQRRESYHGRPSAASVEARALALSEAIVALLRSGSSNRNFAGIYCVRCDFSELPLDAAHFEHAILAGAAFYNASLNGADFDGADLEGVSFVRSHLQGAKFTRRRVQDRRFRSFDAFDHAVSGAFNRRSSGAADAKHPDSGLLLIVGHPRFSCADLRDADFTGFPLFLFVENGLGVSHLGGQTRLSGANLKGAKFDSMSIQFVSQSGHDEPLSALGGVSTIIGNLTYGTFNVSPDGTAIDPDFSESLQVFSSLLNGSDWQSALWPASLRLWLTDHPPRNEKKQTDCER